MALYEALPIQTKVSLNGDYRDSEKRIDHPNGDKVIIVGDTRPEKIGYNVDFNPQGLRDLCKEACVLIRADDKPINFVFYGDNPKTIPGNDEIAQSINQQLKHKMNYGGILTLYPDTIFIDLPHFCKEIEPARNMPQNTHTERAILFYIAHELDHREKIKNGSLKSLYKFWEHFIDISAVLGGVATTALAGNLAVKGIQSAVEHFIPEKIRNETPAKQKSESFLKRHAFGLFIGLPLLTFIINEILVKKHQIGYGFNPYELQANETGRKMMYYLKTQPNSVRENAIKVEHINN
jgi:hypothetical protein